METTRDSTRSIVTPTLIGTGLQLLMVIAGAIGGLIGKVLSARAAQRA
jgi:hypothetical protein